MFPKVSIIIPSYNTVDYIDQAVRSILVQTFQDWELLVVDDHSDDGTWEKLQKYASGKVRIYRNDRNLGNSFTINRGIQLATGSYIAKMDADDVSLPDRIGRQVEFLESRPEVDVAGCGLIKTDRGLTKILALSSYPEHHGDIVRMVPMMGFRFIFGPNIHIADGAVMGKSEWFRKWNYDEQITIAQDFDLYYRARKQSVYANLPDHLYVWRRGGRTTPFPQQMKIVVQRFRTIARYGFRDGTIFESLLAFLFLVPRPIFSLMTVLFHWVTQRIPQKKQDFRTKNITSRINDLLDKINCHEKV
jgi:glycosyltransferase involved in cell wall biosynthesis